MDILDYLSRYGSKQDIALLLICIPVWNNRYHMGNFVTIARPWPRLHISLHSSLTEVPAHGPSTPPGTNNVDDVPQTCVRHDGETGVGALSR